MPVAIKMTFEEDGFFCICIYHVEACENVVNKSPQMHPKRSFLSKKNWLLVL